MSISKSIILQADSYKYSQVFQYPERTEYVYSYIESRGGLWDNTLFFGLQMFIKEYLAKPITQEDIDFAEEVITEHGEPFYREGWEYILREHGGKLPLVIKAVPEGTIVPGKNVLVVIQNTDPKCWWLPSFLETAILRAVWYPTTVATNSYTSRQIILKYLELNGDPSGIGFKHHDFGARGVSSLESAGIGGAAHLATGALGTDTVTALLYVREYYGERMAGYSIPAMEHSTVTSWLKENEVAAYRNFMKLFAKPGAIIAAVSDSYDIYNACENLWGGELRQEIIDSGAVVVIRPDSGKPSEVVLKCIQILDSKFGSVVNSKGFKVLNYVRVIQGDGITHETIEEILLTLHMAGYSADNVAFGQGGALLQMVNRDDLKFAMKCSAIGIRDEDGELEWRDVYKDPITDSGKRSKRGRVTLYRKLDGTFYSGVEDWMKSALETVFMNGELGRTYTFAEVRANSAK